VVVVVYNSKVIMVIDNGAVAFDCTLLALVKLEEIPVATAQLTDLGGQPVEIGLGPMS
jgi:hypothetical protein